MYVVTLNSFVKFVTTSTTTIVSIQKPNYQYVFPCYVCQMDMCIIEHFYYLDGRALYALFNVAIFELFFGEYYYGSVLSCYDIFMGGVLIQWVSL